MTTLQLASWNTNGLNGPVKRAACLDLLRRNHVDIAFIQESHLKTSDVQRFANRQYYVAASASTDSKTRGSLIVLKRSLSITILGKFGSEDGRISYIKSIIAGCKLVFVSVYAPNQIDSLFFTTLSEILTELHDFRIIMGADMNTVVDPALDRSSSAGKHSDYHPSSTSLSRFISEFSLIDVFRVINPTVKQYSFYSSRHKTYSRIDYILISGSISEIHSAVLSSTPLSDHSVVLVKLTLLNTPTKAARWRFNTTLLKNEEYCAFFRTELSKFITENAGSVDDPRMFWYALKGCIRNTSIAFASYFNKSRLAKIDDLESKLTSLEHQQQLSFSGARKQTIEVTKIELNSLLRQRAEFLIHKTRRTYYFHGPRPSHLLSLRLKQNEKYTNITTIRSRSSQTILTEPKVINKEFCNFYSDLYTSEVKLDRDKCRNFIQKARLSSLSQEEADDMQQLITLEEIKEAIQRMKKGKSPGWDGIPPEFYLFFWKELGQFMLDMITTAVDKGSFDRHANSAILTILLKPNKDPSLCGNYRPLSLLNSEIKIYAKVLASRLETHMNKLVHHDQTGFIKSRQATDNLRRLLHVLHFSKDIKSPNAVLSLDAEKAFDRLEWNYLWLVLEAFGLGTNYIKMIKVLYSNPSAMVSSGNIISSPFSITRGSRQGCPLSPLLFALSLEPLAQTIRQHPALSPISFCNTSHSISLFADDILLYINNTSICIPIILEVFDEFSAFSGYKINWTKSSLMPLNSVLDTTTLPIHIPIVKSFKYLGVDIYPSLFSISSKNFQNIMKQVEADLERWTRLPNSLQARVSIIKMDVLPRVNFYSNMIPLSPPRGYWDKMHKLISKFIWGGGRPRLKLTTLQRNKQNGGLAVPNFKYYFWSYVLRPLSYWLEPKIQVSWRPIEENLAFPHRLQDLIYSGLTTKQSKHKLGPIMSFLLNVWNLVGRTTNSTLKWHVQSPIFHNYSLLTGGVPFSFREWSDKGINVMSDIYDEKGLRSFSDLRTIFNLPGKSFFFYLRLRSAMRAYGVPWNTSLSTHKLHTLLNVGTRSRGLVSALYSFITEPSCGLLAIQQVWACDLGIPSKDICWSTVWNNLDKTSKNLNHKLIHFKLVHRMYLTPRKRHFMKLVHSPICDLCSLGQVGSFLHMFWECHDVTVFWKAVSSTLSILLDIDIPYLPKVLLLNDTSSLNIFPAQTHILLAGLTAAKKMLALRWKPPYTLSRTQWLQTFLSITHMELSVAKMHGASQKTIQNWTTATMAVKNLLE